MAEVQEQSPQTVSMSINDLILIQLRDLKENQRELKTELKDIRREVNARIDKQEEKIEQLSSKIDALSSKIDSSSNHGNIMTASVVGIALGVLYSIFK